MKYLITFLFILISPFCFAKETQLVRPAAQNCLAGVIHPSQLAVTFYYVNIGNGHFDANLIGYLEGVDGAQNIIWQKIGKNRNDNNLNNPNQFQVSIPFSSRESLMVFLNRLKVNFSNIKISTVADVENSEGEVKGAVVVLE